MSRELIQIITAGTGALGFAIYFRVSEKNIAAAALGGAAGFGIYLLIYKLGGGLFAANFVAALMIYLYSELCARLLKAPSNIFLIPGIIPLLPGGALYYAMYGIVNEDKEMFVQNGADTAIMTVGIATGIVVGTVMMHYLIRMENKLKKKK